jgi:beta-lactamase class A
MQQTQITPTNAIERLFTSPQIQAEWFDPSFLSQIPLTQVQQIVDGIQSELGPFQSVQAEGESYTVVMAKGKVTTEIVLNNRGQILGLLFQPQSNAITLPAAIEQLQTFPGQVNLLVLEGNTELAAFNADPPLAVGSAFKLAVLAALRQQIEAGQRSWDDVVELQAQDKSLPSGLLQTWYEGALLTLQSLATLMISISDNTATDALIRIVGRESIESLADRNRPFLTTQEFFTLKDPQNAALLQRYREGNEAQRRQVLAEVAELPLPHPSIFAGEPLAIDVEWFFTPRELCTLMQQVADLPLMSVNPSGLVTSNDWSKVSYKGGSEPGVINLTTWLQAKNGKTYCVVATWNNPEAALAEERLLTLYSGIIEELKTRN